MRVAFLIIPCLLIFTYCYPQEVTQSQLINSGDTIEIVIEAFNRPPLRETAEVSEEGEIYCPIIGNIKAEGLSVDKIKEAANAELKKKYFIDADINVEIKTLGKISLEKQRAQQRAKERAEKIGAILDNAHPYAIVGESYNDNIYLTDHDARSDFITTIRPGIKYYKKTSSDKKMDLFFDGSAEAKVYADNSKDNAINPHAQFLFNYGLGKLGLEVRANINKGQETATQLETTSREEFIDYWSGGYATILSADLNRFVWDMGYSYGYRAYDDDPFKRDSTYKDDNIFLTGAVKILPKTYFLLEYQHQWRDYYKGGSINRQHDRYWAGLKGKILSKVTGVMKFGYEKEKFADGGKKKSNAVHINLDYAATSRLNYLLYVEKKIGDSGVIEDNLNDEQLYSLGLRYFPPFNNKLSFRSDIFYHYYDYDSGREDDLYGFGLSSEYKLKKWLKLIGGYKYEQRKSTWELDNYKNNILFVKLFFEL